MLGINAVARRRSCEPRRLAAGSGCDQDAEGEATLPDGLAAPDGLAEPLGATDSLGKTDGATEAGDCVVAGVWLQPASALAASSRPRNRRLTMTNLFVRPAAAGGEMDCGPLRPQEGRLRIGLPGPQLTDARRRCSAIARPLQLSEGSDRSRPGGAERHRFVGPRAAVQEGCYERWHANARARHGPSSRVAATTKAALTATTVQRFHRRFEAQQR